MKVAAILPALFFTATAAQAVDYRVIIDRDPDAIELFIQIPAPLLPEKFAKFPDGFLTSAIQVDITPFRSGTWDHGDAFFADVTATVGGVPVTFEAMSMMVHPLEFDMPFRDPIDAIAAISVCAVPEGLSVFPLSSLTAYLGYIAYPVDGYGDLTITFPQAATVQVAQFDRGRPVRAEALTLVQNGQIALAGFDPNASWWDRLTARLSR